MQKPKSIDLAAESIHAALAAIAEANGGYLSPANVVESARNPDSVLHDEFEWDDENAAESYRLAQAGALIRRVKFNLVKVGQKSKKITIEATRAFQSRPSQRTENGGYESITAIMADPEKREELVTQVLKELSAYRKRYSDLLALSHIWEAVDEAMDELLEPRQGKAGQADDEART
jgi:hypothetical protein